MSGKTFSDSRGSSNNFVENERTKSFEHCSEFCDKPAQKLWNPVFGHYLLRHVFVHIINNFFPKQPQQDPNRNQFGIMEMIYVSLFAQCDHKHTKSGQQHSLHTISRGWKRPYLYTMFDFILVMLSDEHDSIASVRKSTTFFQ